MDDIIKGVHKHKLAQEQHVESIKSQMRGEDVSKGVMSAGNIHSTKKKDSVVKKNIEKMVAENPDSDIEKGRKVPVGTVTNGRKKVAEGKWVDVKKEGSRKPAKVKYGEGPEGVAKIGDKIKLRTKTGGVDGIVYEVGNSGKKFKLKDEWGNEDNKWRNVEDYKKATISRKSSSISKGIGDQMSSAYEELGVLPINIEKGKKVPVGTVSGGYKKVAEGKWTKVKGDKKTPVGEKPDSKSDSKKEDNSRVMQNIKNAVAQDVKDYTSKRGMSELEAMKKVVDVYEKDMKAGRIAKEDQPMYKTAINHLKSEISKKSGSEAGKKSGSGRAVVANSGSTDVKNITDKYTYMKRELGDTKGKVDFVITKRDTKGMRGSQDQFMIEIHQNGKFISDLGTVPTDPTKGSGYTYADHYNKK